MPWKCRLRRLGVHTVLIACAIQGLTPDRRSVVSPWALEWLQVSATIGGPDAPAARMPGNDRPMPSDDIDGEGTSTEIVLPGDPLASTVLSRRLGALHGHPSAANGHGPLLDAPAPRRSAPPRRHPRPVGDRLSSLCRFTC